MKQHVQDRIDKIKGMAKADVRVGVQTKTGGVGRRDNLSSSIRNAKEADVFMSELNAAVRSSKADKK